MALSRDDTVRLLERIAAYDHRKPRTEDVSAYTRASQIGHWGVDEAVDAVDRHYAESTTRIMPGDITQRIRHERRQPENWRDVKALHASNPATKEARARALAAAEGFFGKGADTAKVAALGPLADLTPDQVSATLEWPRNRAVAALHAAHCIERGEPVPNPRPAPNPSRRTPIASRSTQAHVRDAISGLRAGWDRAVANQLTTFGPIAPQR